MKVAFYQDLEVWEQLETIQVVAYAVGLVNPVVKYRDEATAYTVAKDDVDRCGQLSRTIGGRHDAYGDCPSNWCFL